MSTSLERIPDAREVALSSQDTDLLSVIAMAVRDPTVDVAKMQVLLDMKFRVDERNGKLAFTQAKAELQKVLPRIRKDGIIDLGGKGQIKFAKFEDIQAIVQPLLREHGFTTSFDEALVEGGLKRITVTLAHAQGHSEMYSTHVPMQDAGPGRNATQAMVSSNSYGKRRALINALDLQIGGEDDDGNAGDAEFIEETQRDSIRDLMHELGVKEFNFLKFMQVDSIAQITKGKYQKAITALEAKRK